VSAYGYCTACTTRPFANSLAMVPLIGKAGYIGLTALAVNIVVAVVLTLVFRAIKDSNGTDNTVQSDYFADVGDRGVQRTVDESSPIH
jgi:SSS family solute:Na+ symporter